MEEETMVMQKKITRPRDSKTKRLVNQQPIILGADEQPITSTPEVQGSGMPANFMDMLEPKAREYVMEQSLCSNREALRQHIIEKGRVDLSNDDETMFKSPRKGCGYCYGGGRKGWNAASGEVIICDCMRRGTLLNSSPDEFINMEQFLEIFQTPKPAYTRNHTTPKSLRRIESKERKLARKRRSHAE